MPISWRRARRFLVSLLILMALPAAPALSKEEESLPEWLPITSEELALKDCPGNPGAPAMIIYRRVEVPTAQVGELQKLFLQIAADERTVAILKRVSQAPSPPGAQPAPPPTAPL